MDKEEIVDGNSANSAKISGLNLPAATPEEVRPKPAFAMSWREQAQRLQREAYVSYFVLSIPAHAGTRGWLQLAPQLTCLVPFNSSRTTSQ